MQGNGARAADAADTLWKLISPDEIELGGGCESFLQGRRKFERESEAKALRLSWAVFVGLMIYAPSG